MLEKNYDPNLIEKRWYPFWEEHHCFQPKPSEQPYCIMLPPPNVTGSLHMGHGFLFTIIDVLIRYHRACGDYTLWQGGVDHAGIATQMVVERQLNEAGLTRKEIGREAFVEKIWAFKAESGSHISRQLRRLGASIDWDRERYTLDEDFISAVYKVFIELYNEGLIYRGKRLVNWDPILLTAISDLEVINEEEAGKLWHIRYPIENSNEFLTVATTRPETLFGDVAIAIHPDDERYQQYLGKNVLLPLTDRHIPIISDDYVDPLFGSGCVKITPAHDFNDYGVGERHGLQPINIMTADAKLNDNVPPDFRNLDRFDAREKVIAVLKEKNLLIKEEDYRIKIPRGEKSNAIIEPYLTNQWYVKSKVLAEEAIKVVRQGKIKFVPENWDKTYFQWMENIEDWCISRQLWWGHRIPVWYDQSNNIYVGSSLEDVKERYQLKDDIKLQQDEDVLDTWFSSSLWPFVTLGWPENTKYFKTFFPTQVLVTGFDIIFFWVARMIMMSLKFTDEIPFREVYITGLIRDAHGQKMSKSKGNVLDPIDLIDGISLADLLKKRTSGLMQQSKTKTIIEQTKSEFPNGINAYGTDALRFTYCSFASYTREIRFDLNRLLGYRNFCNKLWNATRFILMQVNLDEIYQPINVSKHLSLIDQWILSRLQTTIASAHEHFKNYRFDLLAQTLYDFTWNEFCDWYLEFTKPVLNSDHDENKQFTRRTLIHVMNNLLKLLHPIMPFITEELWQQLPISRDTKTIMLADYPKILSELINQHAEKEIEWLKKIIIAIRTLRSEMTISPAKEIVLAIKSPTEIKTLLIKHFALLKILAKISEVKWIEKLDKPENAASIFVENLEIFMPLAGLIDKEAERERLLKEKIKIEKELNQVKQKLSNQQFIEKAPKAVTEKQQKILIELTEKIKKIESQIKIFM